MTSAIDPTLPITGSPTTASVRANFAAAKDEIEELQSGKLDNTMPTVYFPTLLNGWTEASPTGAPVLYYITAHGDVHIHGLISPGTMDLECFILPPGFRRPYPIWQLVRNSAAGASSAVIHVDGRVIINAPTQTNFALDTLRFNIHH
jgi:hypothetical protein